MVLKSLGNSRLFTIRVSGSSFLVSLKASNRYSKSYLDSLELSIALLADYGERQGWPDIASLTTSHLEEYLYYVQTRPKWFGERKISEPPESPSQSYIESQYRRLKRFFNWLVERGHVDRNPLDLIPHPHVDEKVVPVVSELQKLNLLRLVDPANARTESERFLRVRNRAVLYLCIDTPGRRNELSTLTVNGVDLDRGAILVMGKGRRERWMPIGSTPTAALAEYLQHRVRRLAQRTDGLWVSGTGLEMKPSWIYLMLRTLGQRAGIPGLHAHQFRHTYAVTALRGGMSERVLQIVGGWKKIPDTYMRTLGYEDAEKFHRQISPADKLGQGLDTGKRRGRL